MTKNLPGYRQEAPFIAQWSTFKYWHMLTSRLFCTFQKSFHQLKTPRTSMIQKDICSKSTVCSLSCTIQTFPHFYVRLSRHCVTFSSVQQKANMAVNSRRHVRFAPNLEQIKITEGGIPHMLRNTHAISHLSLRLPFCVFLTPHRL